MFETEITPIVSGIHARAIHVENAIIKEVTEFVKDHTSLVIEANENIERIKVLEKQNDSLSEEALSTDIMSIIYQMYSVEDDERLRAETSQIVSNYENAFAKLEKENVTYFKQLERKKEECKYDKLSYERSYKEMQKQIDLLKSQLECQKGKGEEIIAKPKMSISQSAHSPLPKEKAKEKVVVETPNVIAPGLYRISTTIASTSTSKTYRAIDKSVKEHPK